MGAGKGGWKGLTEEHTCIYAQPVDTEDSVWRGGAGMCWVEGGKGGEQGTSARALTIKTH